MNVFKKTAGRRKRSQIQPQPHRALRTEQQRMGWDETRLSIRHGCEGGVGVRRYGMGMKKPDPDSTGTWQSRREESRGPFPKVSQGYL